MTEHHDRDDREGWPRDWSAKRDEEAGVYGSRWSATPTEEPPVARPDSDQGALLILTEQDVAERCADVFLTAREMPGVSRGQAEELATIAYEAVTESWADHAED
jgi:hypothetical protein